MAQRFAQEGARSVVIADLDQERCDAAAAEIGEVALGVACDVSDHVQVTELIDRAREHAGGIDVFCANAGIGTGLGEDAPDEAWDAIVGVNVMAHVYAARQLVPYWLEHGEGYFVAMASAA